MLFTLHIAALMGWYAHVFWVYQPPDPEQLSLDIYQQTKVKFTTQEYPTEDIYLGEYEVTAYCPCAACCGISTGITASGEMAVEGVTIAADWDVLPMGKAIEIEGIGVRVVQDTGGAIKGNRLDLFMDDHAAALDFGRHTLKVWRVKECLY
jgi:3D (Asp-Asp-Asp) domain-containing protein